MYIIDSKNDNAILYIDDEEIRILDAQRYKMFTDDEWEDEKKKKDRK